MGQCHCGTFNTHTQRNPHTHTQTERDTERLTNNRQVLVLTELLSHNGSQVVKVFSLLFSFPPAVVVVDDAVFRARWAT